MYAVRAKKLGETQLLKGMCNIGHRPTVSGQARTIEVNFFDFDQNLYGEHMRLYFIERVRDEKKFNGLDELKVQLQKDESRIREILG